MDLNQRLSLVSIIRQACQTTEHNLTYRRAIQNRKSKAQLKAISLFSLEKKRGSSRPLRHISHACKFQDYARISIYHQKLKGCATKFTGPKLRLFPGTQSYLRCLKEKTNQPTSKSKSKQNTNRKQHKKPSKPATKPNKPYTKPYQTFRKPCKTISQHNHTPKHPKISPNISNNPPFSFFFRFSAHLGGLTALQAAGMRLNFTAAEAAAAAAAVAAADAVGGEGKGAAEVVKASRGWIAGKC